MNTYNMTRKELRSAGKSIKSLNIGNGGADSDGARDDRIKKEIGAFYDYATSQVRTRFCWNWGLNDPLISSAIESTIPEYRDYGSDGYSEQLYFLTAKEAAIADRPSLRILEVGCGTGGGLNFLSRCNSESTFVGLDISQAAINYANAVYSRKDRVKFVTGDAEALPFGDNEFDVVLNVESSHNYPMLQRFYSEVARVVKPGGVFSMVDIFSDCRYQAMVQAKTATSSLKWGELKDISEGVKDAIRRRMKPGSPFRQALDFGAPLASRVMLQKIVMAAYGAEFVNWNLGALYKLATMAGGSEVIPVEKYLHCVAVKT